MKQALLSYDYPGNVRELRNIIERYAITGKEEFSDYSQQSPSVENEGNDILRTAVQTAAQEHRPLHKACKDFEQAYINQAMAACGGSVAKAANMLGIHRSLLYKKIKAASIDGTVQNNL